MAPTAPTKRKSIRQKARDRLENPLAPRKLHRAGSAVTDGFLDTKRDKRLIRRSAFVSKIAAAAPPPPGSAGVRKAAPGARRRRPSKKLVATLESLADALPALTEEDLQRAAGAAGRGGARPAEGDVVMTRDGKVRHRSLRSRPGALRRKERVVRGEMARFGASLAQLAAVKDAAGPGAGEGMETEAEEAGQQAGPGDAAAAAAPPTAGRWAALRGFIAATMEQNPAFASKG